MSALAEMHGSVGVLEADSHGEHVRCHVCGGWFVNLASHVLPAHGLRAADYRQRFGLNKRCPLVSPVESDRRRAAGPHLAKYQHLSPMTNPDFPRGAGNVGGLRPQHLLKLRDKASEPAHGAKISAALIGKPRPYMADRNRKLAEAHREDRRCVVCGVMFRIKRSHPKTCCSAICRTERRRRLIADRAVDMGRKGGAVRRHGDQS